MDGNNGSSRTNTLLNERLAAFRRSDAEREALLNDIVRSYEALQYQYEQKLIDYENEIESRRTWQNKATEAQKYVQSVQRSTDANPFVLALIDGDGAIFLDALYKQGSDGGAEAAHQLQQEVKAHVASLYPDENTTRWNILVHICYNMEGLAHKLRAVGILKNPNEMGLFARAFGLNQPLFSFIDVGSGKERADHKLRETFRLFLPNIQCKHILFGGTHDNGYLPLLDPYKRDPAMASKISLLEALPAQPGFKQLGFQMVQFPSVFRSQGLPDRPGAPSSPLETSLPYRANMSIPGVSSPQTTSHTLPAPMMSNINGNSTTFVPKSSSPAPSTDSGDSSWATISRKTVPSTTEVINVASKKTALTKSILLNADDERIDAELPRADKSATNRLFERINKKKVCNDFHITGRCEQGKYCDYDHGERLSPGEQLALRHNARRRSCINRSSCRDFDCTFGHVCPHGARCFGNGCFFDEVHGVDQTPAFKLYDDGRQERVVSRR